MRNPNTAVFPVHPDATVHDIDRATRTVEGLGFVVSWPELWPDDSDDDPSVFAVVVGHPDLFDRCVEAIASLIAFRPFKRPLEA